MKKILIIFTLLLNATLLVSHEGVKHVEWLTWNDGYKKAIATGKIAFIDSYTDWCRYCKKMDGSTFLDTSIVNKLNTKFIPIKFNPEQEEKYIWGIDTLTSKELLQKLNKGKNKGYPSYFFYFPKQDGTLQSAGYHSVIEMNEVLDKVLGKK